MVGFAVVGLGMGRGRAKLITQTEGARLSCVCDLRDELAREGGESVPSAAPVGGTPYGTDAKDHAAGRGFLSRGPRRLRWGQR